MQLHKRLLISFLFLFILVKSFDLICHAENGFYPLQTGLVITNAAIDGTSVIDKMVSAASSLNNYSADYTMAVHKGKQIAKEAGVFYFRKPKLLRIEVREGQRKGSVALLAKDGKVHGHMGGFMKYFSGAVSPNSQLAKALNGFPMSGTDFYSLALYLKNMLKEGDRSFVTENAVQTAKTASPTYLLDMCEIGKSNEQILLKRIFIDAKTYWPVFWEDYSEGKLFTESSWKNIRANLNLPDKLFQP